MRTLLQRKILEAIDGERSINDIAQLVGCTPEYVSKLVDKYNIPFEIKLINGRYQKVPKRTELVEKLLK